MFALKNPKWLANSQNGIECIDAHSLELCVETTPQLAFVEIKNRIVLSSLDQSQVRTYVDVQTCVICDSNVLQPVLTQHRGQLLHRQLCFRWSILCLSEHQRVSVSSSVLQQSLPTPSVSTGFKPFAHMMKSSQRHTVPNLRIKTFRMSKLAGRSKETFHFGEQWRDVLGTMDPFIY